MTGNQGVLGTNLPIDILAEIFGLCLSSDRDSTFKQNDAPMVLTHICRNWRGVALSTTSLWSCISVPGWPKAPRGIVKLVKLWISRADKAPLDVRLYMSRFLIKPAPLYLRIRVKWRNRGILKALKPFRRQIRSLKGRFPQHILPNLGTDEMLNASEFDYEVYLNDNCQSQTVTLDFGPTRKALNTLILKNCRVNISSIVDQRYLTSLEISGHWQLFRDDGEPRAVDLLQLLLQLPNLKKAVFESDLDFTTIVQINRRIKKRTRLPKLESLTLLSTLLWDTHAGVSSLLDHICTPNLRMLKIYGALYRSYDPGCDWPTLYGFLKSSLAPLERLWLKGFTQPQLIHPQECLAYSPVLTHLVIQDSFIDDYFLEALTFDRAGKASEAPLLPKLSTFALISCPCREISLFALARFLRSRAAVSIAGISRLSHVEINGCSGITEEDKPVLEECGIESLKFNGYL